MDTIKLTFVRYFEGQRRLLLSEDWKILKPLSEQSIAVEAEYEIYKNDIPEFKSLIDYVYRIANRNIVDSKDKEKIDCFRDIITRVERGCRPEVEKPRSEEELKIYK